MRYSLILVLSVLGLCAAGSARGQESGLAFLRIGTNAAAQALGDAGVAFSRDAFATYWNPAGLAATPDHMAGLALHRWAGDVETYGLAARFRLGERQGAGLFVTATGSGDLEAREQPGPPEGFFDVQFLSVGAAYGMALGPVRVGATVKWLTERIFAQQASGAAVDLGLQADVPGDLIRVGLAYQNLGKMSRLNAERTELPRMLRAGVALFPLRVLASLDEAPILNTFVLFEVSHDATAGWTRYHVGVSAEVLELVTVRAGYLTRDALRDFTFGGGLGYGHFVLDYALIPFEEGFGGTGHILTLSYSW